MTGSNPNLFDHTGKEAVAMSERLAWEALLGV